MNYKSIRVYLTLALEKLTEGLPGYDSPYEKDKTCFINILSIILAIN